MLYRFWMLTIGMTFFACSISATVTSDNPTCRIFPASCAFLIAPKDSSTGTLRSIRCNCHRSIRSSFNRLRLLSTACAKYSGRPFGTHCPGPTAAGGEQQRFFRPMPFYQGRLRDFSDNFRFGSTDPIKFLLCVTLDDSELTPYRNVLEQLHDAKTSPKGEKTNARPSRKLKLGDGHAKVIRIEGELKYVDDSTCEVFTHNININGEFVLFRLENNEPVFIPALAKKVTFDERAKVVNAIAALLTNSFQLVGTNRSMTTEKLNISEVPQDFLMPSFFKRSLYRLSTSREFYGVFKEINQRFDAKPFSFGDISFSIDPKTEEVEIMIEKSSIRLPL